MQRPELIAECADAIGAQSIVLSMDVNAVDDAIAVPVGLRDRDPRRSHPNGQGRARVGARRRALGAGELVVNSIDADGTREGYEMRLTRLIAEAVRIPVIASGGAGKPEHLYDVLTKGNADAALVASMVHYGDYRVSELKTYLHRRGVKMRMNW